MNILVVGGLGYLGSIISNKFKLAENKVDIYDACIWDNEDVKNDIKYDEFMKGTTHIYLGPLTATVEKYDLIIWCCDIDIDSYYNTNYYKEDEEVFREVVEKSKRFYYIGSFLEDKKTERIAYQNFLKNRLEIIRERDKAFYLNCGILYGPSPRMRWDTIINLMIFSAIQQNTIFLQNDWLTRFPICNVADAAQFIADSNFENKYPCLCSNNMSLIEMAYVVAKCLKEVEVIAEGLDMRAEDFSMKRNVQENFGLISAIENILKGLESGMLPDYEKDCYNNEIMIGNMINGKQVYHNLIGK